MVSKITILYNFNYKQCNAFKEDSSGFLDNIKSVHEISDCDLLIVKSTSYHFINNSKKILFININLFFLILIIIYFKSIFFYLCKNFYRFFNNLNYVNFFSLKKLVFKIMFDKKIYLAGITTMSCLNQTPKDFILFEYFNFPTIMLHYSHNIFPINTREHKNIPMPNWVSRVKVNKHYVMSDNHAVRLNSLPIFGKAVSITPFLLESAETVVLEDDKVNIAIFDEMPKESVLQKNYIDTHYYTVQRMSMFLSDLFMSAHEIQSEFGIRVNLLFKPKRAEQKIHDKTYIKIRKELIKYYDVNTIDPYNTQSDLFNKIQIAIAIPFTSALVYAQSKKLECFYYDPFGDIAINQYNPSEFRLVTSHSNLKKHLSSILLV